MLKIVSERIVRQLIRKGAVLEERKAVYIYGCELLLSTASSVVCILAVGALAGRFVQAAAFVLFFMPVRTVASGYHAPSYGRCFILTATLAFLCVMGAELCSGSIPGRIVWLLFMAGQALIWIRGPFRSVKHPLKEEQVTKNRSRMHRIQMLETAACAGMQIAGKQRILCTAVFTTVTVALMIIIAEKEECKNVGNVSRAD